MSWRTNWDHPFDFFKQMMKWKDSKRAMQAKYRQTFLTPHGMDVLDDILRHCSYFDTLDPYDPAAVALANLGKVIMANMGVISDGTTRDYIEALSRVIPEDQ